jgi:outer membrane protein TolC
MKYRLLAIILFSVGTALAQTNSFLSWDQCLAQTKAHNPDLVSARAAVQELEYGVASASAGFLPQVTASVGAGFGETELNNNWTETESANGQLRLTQDLFSGGGNIAKRRKALAQLEIGNEQYRKVLSDVELRTRLAYIDVLYAQDLVVLTEKIEERRGSNVRLIQLRFDGGRENAGSLARSKAQFTQARFEVREAKRSRTYALRNLAAAMGQMDPAVGAAGDLKAGTPDALVDLQGLVKQTPDYHIATTQIEASAQGMKVTRSARFPSISFDASASTRSSNYDVYNGSWNIGLNASMPLYTGNRLNSEVAAAKERIIQTEMDLMDTANTLMASLQQRWNLYADAVENEAVQKELFEAEQLRAEISTSKYKQGLLSYEDWDIIESNLINQGKTHLQRRRTAEIEQARWKNALGWSVWQAAEESE